jgi:hypothetical protein
MARSTGGNRPDLSTKANISHEDSSARGSSLLIIKADRRYITRHDEKIEVEADAAFG